jgi:GT2 family glycosyltransferase
MSKNIFDIAGEKKIDELVVSLKNNIEKNIAFEFYVPKDYIFLDLLEKKINKNYFLISGIEENIKYIKICIRKYPDMQDFFIAHKAEIEIIDIEQLTADIDVSPDNSLNFQKIKELLSKIPDSSIKRLSITSVTDEFSYEELEKLFSEAYRVLSFGSPFYLEYTGAVISEYLLKGYLEYAGFIEVFPAVSAGEYEAGKVKIYSNKGSLSELSKKPKKVLLNIDSEKPEKLMECSVFIRDLHNKYNNWDLYLVSDEWKFFDENIYLKYCSEEMPPENLDYIIYLDDFNPIPDIDYNFKKLNSRKIDLFYSQENLNNITGYLSKHGIEADDFFFIADTASNTLEKFNSDFPYISKIGFKILPLEEDFNALSLKNKALLMQFSSFYAGAGFNYFLADSLCVPSYNTNSGEINYERCKSGGNTDNYDVSIVIPVYNNFTYTKQCIFSIFKNHPLLNFEIIIVDNGSTDETKEFFEKFQDLKNFKLIANKKNLGFAKASNQGARIAKSPYVLFLNNDTVVSKGAIDELYYSVNAGEAKSLNVKASGSLLLYPDRKIQQAGIMFEECLIPYNAYAGMNISGCMESDIKNAVYLRSFNALTAACLLVDKEIFFEAGGFDEGYINGFEDVDLCLKLRESGYKLVFNPKSIVFHFEEKTPGRKKHDIENINRFMDKWKFKYKRDNYIFAEMDNLFIVNKSKDDVSKYIIPLKQIRTAEDKINELAEDMQYGEALKLCDEILKYDKYNISMQKKRVNIRHDLNMAESKKDVNSLLNEKEKELFSCCTVINNILKSNKDVKVSLDQNEIYQIWIKYNEPSGVEIERQRAFKFEYSPKISIIMPVYNTPEEYLKKAIESVIRQTYVNWELCIADDASTEMHVKEILKYYKELDERIKVIYKTENGHISKASNSALSLATGDYVALLDHDDELSEFALFFVVKEINNYPDAKLIYSDEDKLHFDGSRVLPYFKSDWNPDLFLSQNMISHLGVYKKSVVDEIGGFREGYEGSQDYDLALRFIEKIKYSEIRHIPRILYHWRIMEGSTALSTNNKSYAVIAARKAVQDHLDRLDIKANVVEAPLMPMWNRVIYDIEAKPLVSIIIPTHNQYYYLKDLIDSIFEKTSYKNFEIILINNGGNDKQTLEYLKLLNGHKKITVMDYDKPFNYSKIINFAVEYAKGDVLVILNNDIKVINDDWLRELVSHALRPEIGVVGAKLLYADDTIRHAGAIINSAHVACHAHSYISKDAPGYFGRANLLQNYSAVTGACMAMRRTIYEEAGGMDENLAAAYNDIDFCIKIMQLGYYNVYTPYAMLYHYESKTRGYEDTEEKKVRLKKEADYIKAKWGKILEYDFAYSPNLSLKAAAIFTTPVSDNKWLKKNVEYLKMDKNNENIKVLI